MGDDPTTGNSSERLVIPATFAAEILAREYECLIDMDDIEPILVEP